MADDDKAQESIATFSFLLHSGEILDREGRPTGVTLQDRVVAAEARLAAYLAIDPELRNVPVMPAGPGQAALMELVKLLARHAARQQFARVKVEDVVVSKETKAPRKRPTSAKRLRPVEEHDAPDGIAISEGAERGGEASPATRFVRHSPKKSRSYARQELRQLQKPNVSNWYVAVLFPEAAGGWSVFFPDLPGCQTQGETIEEARRMAAEAPIGHIASIRAHGEPVPTPRTLEEIRADPTWTEEHDLNWSEVVISLVKA